MKRTWVPLWLLPALAWAGSPTGSGSGVVLTGFPFVQQEPDFCGEADVAMAMGHWGFSVSQDEVFQASGVDPLLGRGAWTRELSRALKTLNVDPGKVWFSVEPGSAKQIKAQFDAMVADLKAGVPSIVCMHYDASPDTTEHFRLVTGYDAGKDEVVYQEPAEKNGADRRMARATFEQLWPFHYSKQSWTLIRLTVPKPSAAPSLPKVEGPSPAEVSQHVQTLSKTLPEGSGVAYQAPFLIIGSKATREKGAHFTKWFDTLLLADFFSSVPTGLQEVWLFSDGPSYVKASKTLFHTDPDTPYGYYLSSRNALIMNVGPGYGTLSHELVHPFMHHAWANVPAWLNEGVASLFEYPAEQDGHVVGKVNWRLPALQQALKAHQVGSFYDLTHTTDAQFYDDDRGLNYAQARYLIYWLQERDLLQTFVKRALELGDTDPTGWKALGEVLKGDPDAQFKAWATFTAQLSQHGS